MSPTPIPASSNLTALPRSQSNDLSPLSWRDLLFNLVAKDIKVRYMGTVVGVAWSLGNPLLVTATYFVVFTYFFPSRQDRFVLHLATGMLHWSLFSQIVLMGCDWMTSNGNLLKKIYFPRIIIPLSGMMTSMAFWAAALLVYSVLYFPLGGQFSLAMLAYLLLLPIFLAFSFGIGLIFCITHALVRDLRHLIDVLLPLLFWLTPVIWQPASLPPQILPILALNPLYPFFTSFDAILHDGVMPSPWKLLLCFVLGMSALFCGLWLFRAKVDKVVERL